jgi:hypothetical protein
MAVEFGTLMELVLSARKDIIITPKKYVVRLHQIVRTLIKLQANASNVSLAINY